MMELEKQIYNTQQAIVVGKYFVDFKKLKNVKTNKDEYHYLKYIWYIWTMNRIQNATHNRRRLDEK